MDERGQFTFYRSFWEAVRGLPKKDRLPIYEAIIAYALDGLEPVGLSKSQAAFFLLVKPNLDSARKKAANGRQGGSKPKAKGKQTESKKENEEEKEKEIETEGEEEKEKKHNAPAEGKRFTAFWEAYPNKIGREKAWEAWKDLSPDAVTVEKIMDGLEGWKRSEQWTENSGRFIPRAAKFLSEGHWGSPPAVAPKDGERMPDADEVAAIQRMMNHTAEGVDIP